MANQVEQQRRVNPIERAQAFSQLTRKHIQPLPPQTITSGGSVQFTLTKNRLLSRVYLICKGTMNLIHASSTAGTAATFAPYSLIKTVTLDYNNGFTPIKLTGIQLYLYNLLRDNAKVLEVATSATSTTASGYRNLAVMGLQSKASEDGGQDNPFRFIVELPVMLNERDPIGLFLLQNEDVTVTVNVEFNDVTVAGVMLSSVTGYTVSLKNSTIAPYVETFSIPPIPEALPDLGMVKLVNAKTETISAAGVHTVKLTPGNVYRKLAFYLQDSAGGEFDGDLTSDFELIFNEADTPVKITPWLLSGLNQIQYGTILPQGVWVFDFSYQGLANYGGARDYIDSARMTELWLRFTAVSSGSIQVIWETLARAQ